MKLTYRTLCSKPEVIMPMAMILFLTDSTWCFVSENNKHDMVLLHVGSLNTNTKYLRLCKGRPCGKTNLVSPECVTPPRLLNSHELCYIYVSAPRKQPQCKVNEAPLSLTLALNSSTPIMGCHHMPLPWWQIPRHETQCCHNSMENGPNCTRLQMTVNGPALNTAIWQ